jgi:hypothetical protein
MSAGRVGAVRIESEKGRPCALMNPWQSKRVSITEWRGHTAARVGGSSSAEIRYRLTEGCIRFDTRPGAIYEIIVKR